MEVEWAEDRFGAEATLSLHTVRLPSISSPNGDKADAGRDHDEMHKNACNANGETAAADKEILVVTTI